MKLRIGFLGLGARGIHHLRQFHRTLAAQSEAVALCGRAAANLRRAREAAPTARVFDDGAELIHSELDAVCIATPNFTHVPLALEALKAGKHLLLEQPCGITRAECHLLAKAAARTDRVVMLGHEPRYSPLCQHLKALVDAGEIGRPRMVWAREFRASCHPTSGDWGLDARRSGGLLVANSCSHFDLMNWWVGARPVRVTAFGGKTSLSDSASAPAIHDHATVSFDYDSGTIGALQVCQFAGNFLHEELELGIVGEGGALQTRFSTREILQWKRGAGGSEPAVIRPAASDSGAAEGLHAAFLAAVRDGKPPLTTVAACLDGTLLAIAAEESLQHGHTVEV